MVGHAEVAFSLTVDEENPDSRKVQVLGDSALVVFFPTVLPTHVGFLIQGPYRTTPSRDNVPPNDGWNKRLVRETGGVLIEALRWLSAKKWLDAGALQCLPLQREKFSAGLLAPLFDRVVRALKTELRLPCSDGEYAAAADVQLSRTQDLRDLFHPDQLGALLKTDRPVKWLSADITSDRTPALRQYLIHELKLSEQTPEMILPKLSASFLEAQPDDWIVRLYEYLTKVPALTERLDYLSLVRLQDGTHVPAFIMGHPQAFLPAATDTEFPTVRRSVCARPQAKKFLQSLKLTEPDLVDDVIRNLLPKYKSPRPNIGEYAADIDRILHAFKTDSTAQKEKLINSLKLTRFVMAKEAANGSSILRWPDHVYLATARLKELFAGVPGIYIVDDSQDCLRGEEVRDLLEACGATRYIYPVELNSGLSDHEKYELRLARGHVSATYEKPIEDYDLRGLPALLKQLPTLGQNARIAKARMLWESLIELQDRRGQSVFSGTYRWQYHQWRSASFDSLFIRHLNGAAWVPDADGELQAPSAVLFDLLGWPADPFLLSRIHFKKPVVEELAREAGFEPGVLDMLKRLGLTSTAQLMARLNLDGLLAQPVSPEPDSDEAPETIAETSNDNKGEFADEKNGASEERSQGSHRGSDLRGAAPVGSGGQQTGEKGEDNQSPGGTGQRTASRPARNGAERTFVSYVAAHPDDGEEGEDPDGLSHADRVALESRAVEFIRSREPVLKVMPAGNKGFDLIETDANDEPERWIEVKAMKGCLADRPVGLSSVQFEFARQHGEQYWLYVVEYAADSEQSRIVKINNPAGRAGTFTFDKGWMAIADIDGVLDKAS